MVNTDGDGYSNNLNNQNILRKPPKNDNLLKTNIKLKPKYKLSGGRSRTVARKSSIEGLSVCAGQGCSGAGTHGNGVPTPFARFAFN